MTPDAAGGTEPELTDFASGWLRLGSAVTLSTIGGVGMWSVVVALPAIQAGFGVGRAAPAPPYTLAMIGFACGGVPTGRFAGRLGIGALRRGTRRPSPRRRNISLGQAILRPHTDWPSSDLNKLWLAKCLFPPVIFGRGAANPRREDVVMDISGIGSSSALHAMSGASTGSPPQQKMSNLFDAIDTGGAGSITQSQFTQAFQTMSPPAVFQQQGADAIFAALDPNGTGSVSKPDFVSTMSQLMASLRADTSSPSASSPSDTLAASLQSLNQIDPTSVSPNAAPGALFNFSI